MTGKNFALAAVYKVKAVFTMILIRTTQSGNFVLLLLFPFVMEKDVKTLKKTILTSKLCAKPHAG